MASRSRTFATRRACGRTATAAPAWSRSKASACWRRHAAAIPRTAWRSRPTARGRVTSQKMVLELLLSDVPETSYTLDSELDRWAKKALGRQAPFRSPASAGRRTSRIRRSPCTSTPASSAAAACAPVAKSRSTTSSATPSAARTRRSCSTSTIRWAIPRASPAANASRRVRPARSCPRARSGRSWPTSRWSRSARTAASAASSPTTSRTTRFSSCRARTVPPNSSRLCVKGRYGFDYVQHKHRLTDAAHPQAGRDQAQGLHRRSGQLERRLPRSQLGGGARRSPPTGCAIFETRTASDRWPASVRRRARTKKPTCSRSWCAPASARTTSITARASATHRASPR